MGAINKINVNGVTYDILGLPVGTIFTSALPQTNSGVHLLDGSYIATNGIYGDFCKLVKKLVEDGYNLLCSEEEFENDVELTGSCGKFVLYEDDRMLRLPKITTFVQGLSDLTNIGNAVEAGLPNITGAFGLNGGYSASGAIQVTVSGDLDDYKNSGGAGYATSNFTLDASKSSIIYGKSDTVQPPSVKYPYYIVLATVKQTDIEVNIDNVVNDLNNKADKISIFNIMPDYSRTQVKELDVEHIAECNGYLLGQLNGYNSSDALLVIDNVQVARGIVWYGNVLSSYMVPVGKYSTYKLTGGYRGDNGTKLNFVPCKGN
jgi:hypothetical protein